MKRRIKGVINVVLAAAVLLSGCSAFGKTDGRIAKNNVNLSLWSYYTGAQLEEFNRLIEEFNAGTGREKGIVVDVISEGSMNDLSKNLMAAIHKEPGAPELPDIFAAYVDTVYELDDLGLIEDLAPYFSEEEKGEYVEEYLKEGDLYNDGSLKIFPVAKATEILMLNETDWNRFAKETGVELSSLATMEGLVETSKLYYEWTDSKTEKKDDGKAFFGRDALGNYMYVGAKQLGTDIISMDQQGKLSLHFPREVARKLWDNYYVPFIHGYFSAVGRFRSDDVKTGNALCYVGSSSSASYFPTEVILNNDEKYPISVKVLEAPRFAGGEDYAVQQGAGMAVIKGDEDKVKACVEFLKWFTEEETNIQFSIESGYLPVKTAANNIEKVEMLSESKTKVSEGVRVSLATVQNCKLYTVKGREQKIRNILTNNMQDLASSDREAILGKQASGESLELVISVYDSDKHFEDWYSDCYNRLAAAVEEVNSSQE